MITPTKATWIETLISQYATEAHVLDKYRKTLDLDDPQEAEEADKVSEMLSDMRYALTWLKRGRRPGSRRGVEITDVYRQREIYIKLSGQEITDAERLRLVDALLALSDRERTCFLLHMAQGLTLLEISSKLNLSKRSVQEYVTRAKDKISKEFL
ncbi:sigma-70 family RNA polymerase sigma factor [Paenibacillus illinoisensis]|uniref:sigma-70 family RNA polymerase sigma factor n=1 Tax=Paenibacillus illinoisensis TaxID=59845 RepID=UPI000FD8513D|nr:sigma-70 family RNA polymerase sigma factor [Paenibacillus illinoisensis]